MSDVTVVDVVVEGLGPTVIDVVERGPAGPAGAGSAPIASSTILGNGLGDTALPQALNATAARTILGLATFNSPTFAGLTLSGLQSFTGTSTVGLRLKSLTSVEYGLLIPGTGDLFVDSTTDRIDARLARGTVELIDSAGGQVIGGSLDIAGDLFFRNGVDSTRIARAAGASGRLIVYAPNLPTVPSVEIGGNNSEIRLRNGAGQITHSGTTLAVFSTGTTTLWSNSVTGQILTGINTEVIGQLTAATVMLGGSSGPLLRNNAGTIEARNNANNAMVPLSGSRILVDAGSASVPTISFSGDPNTGFYSSLADFILVTTGGFPRTVWGNLGTGASFAVTSSIGLSSDVSAANPDVHLTRVSSGLARLGTTSALSNASLELSNLTASGTIASGGSIAVGNYFPSRHTQVAGAYDAVWMSSSNSGVIGETTSGFRAVNLSANAVRANGGGWQCQDTTRNCWIVATGYEANANGFAVFNAPATAGSASFSELFAVRTTGTNVTNLTASGTITASGKLTASTGINIPNNQTIEFAHTSGYLGWLTIRSTPANLFVIGFNNGSLSMNPVSGSVTSSGPIITNSNLTASGTGSFGGAVTFATNVWNNSSDGLPRVFYQSNSNTVYRSGGTGSHIFRNGADATLLTLTDAGNLTASGTINSGLITSSSGANTFKFSDGPSNITPNLTIGTSGGRSISLLAGTGGTALVFDQAGTFSISRDTKANIDAGSSGGVAILTMSTTNVIFTTPSTVGSGVANSLTINSTINQTGTAGSTNLLINRTETALGSGAHNFADFQVGGSSRFSVSNAGNITMLTGSRITTGSAGVGTFTINNDGNLRWQFDAGNFNVSGNIQPTSNNARTLGTAGLRWATVFGVAGDFSGNLTASGTLSTLDINIGPPGFQWTINRENTLTGAFRIMRGGVERFSINPSAADVATFSAGVAVGGNFTASGTLRVGGGTVVASILSATATLDFPSIGSNGIETLTMTVTGAVAGDSVFLGVPAGLDAGLIFCASVTAANTVTVRLHNSSGGSIDPASGTFRATVIRF